MNKQLKNPEAGPVYAIPGMSTDPRIFARIELDQTLHTVNWIQPVKNESFSAYIERLSNQIDFSRKPVLMGVSFGGMVALELAKRHQLHQVVLISSIKSQEERPNRLNLMRDIPFYKLSFGNWRYKLLPYFGPLVGLQDKGEIALLQEMFSSFDDQYRMWAIKQIIHWENDYLPPALLHIHGTRDPIFPSRHIKNAHFIKGGDHFLVYRHARKVSALIQDFLNQGLISS